MLEVQKALNAVAMPLGTSLIFGVIALGAGLLNRRRAAIVVGLVAVSWLWFWSTPVVSDSVRGYLERRAPAKTVAELPTADVIVVLGGAVSGPLMPWRPYPDLHNASDRVWHAARLYHAGKAPRILLSGGLGAVPSYTGDEASAMALVLKDLGVPASALIFEKKSRTTSENASESAKILSQLGARRVLLVTSALHMPRALLSFRSNGMEIIPASTDAEVVPRPPQVMDWVPDAEALMDSTQAMHEVLGLARCRLLGC